MHIEGITTDMEENESHAKTDQEACGRPGAQ